jgi:hypothetical protein
VQGTVGFQRARVPSYHLHVEFHDVEKSHKFRGCGPSLF